MSVSLFVVGLVLALVLPVLFLALGAALLVRRGAWVMVWPSQLVELDLYNLHSHARRFLRGRVVISLPYRLVLQEDDQRVFVDPQDIIGICPLPEETDLEDIPLGSMVNLTQRPERAHIAR
jgi:hypothetical protein